MLGPFTFTFTLESEEFEKFEKVAALRWISDGANNTIITIICQFYCFSIASTELCELVHNMVVKFTNFCLRIKSKIPSCALICFFRLPF